MGFRSACENLRDLQNELRGHFYVHQCRFYYEKGRAILFRALDAADPPLWACRRALSNPNGWAYLSEVEMHPAGYIKPGEGDMPANIVAPFREALNAAAGDLADPEVCRTFLPILQRLEAAGNNSAGVCAWLKHQKLVFASPAAIKLLRRDARWASAAAYREGLATTGRFVAQTKSRKRGASGATAL